MSDTIVLDARPLSQIAHPRKFDDITDWFEQAIAAGWRVVIPEVADYEVRRLLLKREAAARIRALDVLIDGNYYAAITTAVMREAAQVWADAENSGRRFAHPDTLNADAILIAQAHALGDPRDVTVITKNTSHFSPFVNAVWWKKFAV